MPYGTKLPYHNAIIKNSPQVQRLPAWSRNWCGYTPEPPRLRGYSMGKPKPSRTCQSCPPGKSSGAKCTGPAPARLTGPNLEGLYIRTHHAATEASRKKARIRETEKLFRYKCTCQWFVCTNGLFFSSLVPLSRKNVEGVYGEYGGIDVIGTVVVRTLDVGLSCILCVVVVL